jgi:hypothetical protein
VRGVASVDSLEPQRASAVVLIVILSDKVVKTKARVDVAWRMFTQCQVPTKVYLGMKTRIKDEPNT